MSKRDDGGAMRTAFEAWMSDDGQHPRLVARNSRGEYIALIADSAWTTWQAAWAAAREMQS